MAGRGKKGALAWPHLECDASGISACAPARYKRGRAGLPACDRPPCRRAFWKERALARIVYVNGALVPEEDAKISVFDRGFIFADGIYEVSAVVDGGLVDNDAHLARLERSLKAIDLAMPCPKDEIVAAQKELIATNRLVEGSIYLQVT